MFKKTMEIHVCDINDTSLEACGLRIAERYGLTLVAICGYNNHEADFTFEGKMHQFIKLMKDVCTGSNVEDWTK